jgi:hypothetical protein
MGSRMFLTARRSRWQTVPSSYGNELFSLSGANAGAG